MEPRLIDMPSEVKHISSLSASRDLIAVIDKESRLWTWSASLENMEALKMKSSPSLTSHLKRHRIKRVFLGNSYIFAMGDHIGRIQS
jgi:hypothetical protein